MSHQPNKLRSLLRLIVTDRHIARPRGLLFRRRRILDSNSMIQWTSLEVRYNQPAGLWVKMEVLIDRVDVKASSKVRRAWIHVGK